MLSLCSQPHCLLQVLHLHTVCCVLCIWPLSMAHVICMHTQLDAPFIVNEKCIGDITWQAGTEQRYIGPLFYSAWWCLDMKTVSTFPNFCKGNSLTVESPPQWTSKACKVCFYHFCQPEEAVEKIIELPMIQDTMVLMWCHCDKLSLQK